MKTFWKYVLGDTEQRIKIPKDGIVRYVSDQSGRICIWVEVDTENKPEERMFEIYGTGSEIRQEYELNYLGSAKIQGGDFIFHVYERIL